MQKFFSISQYPGKTGQYYYHGFFKKYKIEAEYTPVGTNNLNKTFEELALINPSGISISMPFKQHVIDLVDSIDDSVKNYNTCNTIKFEEISVGYNADLFGVLEVCKFFEKDEKISILGNGCMANMFKKFLNTDTATMYSRSLGNWNARHDPSKVVINCTALGTSEKTSPLDFIQNETKIIIDLAVNNNDLKKQSAEKNVVYIDGLKFYKAQFLRQFEIYTNYVADPELFDYLTKLKNQ